MTRRTLVLLGALGVLGVGRATPLPELFGPPEDLLRDWRPHEFAGLTAYAVVEDAGETFVEAVAEGTASGLVREIGIAPDELGTLAWSWWVEAPVAVADVREKPGDDFAARVYLVFDGGWAFWRTTTLVYVWGPQDAPTDPWPNPFTAQARMIAAERGAPTERWHRVRRDVVADYRAAFGTDPPPVVAVAVMTDTDQSGARARARYADLRFDTADAPTQKRR